MAEHMSFLIRDIPRDVWTAARRRAALEGRSMNGVLRVLIAGYAAGTARKPRKGKRPTGPKVDAGVTA